MPRTKHPSPKKQLCLDLDIKLHDSLYDLMKITKADSLTEVVRHAIQLYELLIDQKLSGRKIVLQERGKKDREVFLI